MAYALFLVNWIVFSVTNSWQLMEKSDFLKMDLKKKSLFSEGVWLTPGADIW